MLLGDQEPKKFVYWRFMMENGKNSKQPLIWNLILLQSLEQTPSHPRDIIMQVLLVLSIIFSCIVCICVLYP